MKRFEKKCAEAINPRSVPQSGEHVELMNFFLFFFFLPAGSEKAERERERERERVGE